MQICTLTHSESNSQSMHTRIILSPRHRWTQEQANQQHIYQQYMHIYIYIYIYIYIHTHTHTQRNRITLSPRPGCAPDTLAVIHNYMRIARHPKLAHTFGEELSTWHHVWQTWRAIADRINVKEKSARNAPFRELFVRVERDAGTALHDGHVPAMLVIVLRERERECVCVCVCVFVWRSIHIYACLFVIAAVVVCACMNTYSYECVSEGTPGWRCMMDMCMQCLSLYRQRLCVCTRISIHAHPRGALMLTFAWNMNWRSWIKSESGSESNWV